MFPVTCTAERFVATAIIIISYRVMAEVDLCEKKIAIITSNLADGCIPIAKRTTNLPYQIYEEPMAHGFQNQYCKYPASAVDRFVWALNGVQ